MQKLKEVNGLKTHNLKVEENDALRSGPIVYINNPVEAKLPNAYMTIDQFKNTMLDRHYQQKQEIEKIKKMNAIKFLKNTNKKFKRIKIFKMINHNVKIVTKGSTKNYNMPPAPSIQTTTKFTVKKLNGVHHNLTTNINSQINQNADISSDESDVTETTTDDSITETIFTDILETENLIFNLSEVNKSLADTADSALEEKHVTVEDTTETNTDAAETTTETIITETETDTDADTTETETETMTEASTMKATRRTQSVSITGDFTQPL